MEANQILYMNGGDGETSYAKNSLIQKEVILKAKSILEESVVRLSLSSFPKCVKLADLGCSSGPNTLSLVWEIMDIIYATCQRVNHKAPMFQVFLNDLPGNDFNTIFRSLPSFYEKLKKEKGSEFEPCFIAGMPGTFYGRLFPDCFLHFVYSSNSLQWRSQVPEGLVGESGVPLNKGNIHIAKTSPHHVLKAYSDLFEKDFTLFLRSRSQEMVPGGQMVLVMLGSTRKADSSSNQSCSIWELLGFALNDMVLEGKVEEAKLDWFNLPFYAPTIEEAKAVIQTEGTSFNIHRFETFEVAWDCNMDEYMSNKGYSFEEAGRGKYVAMTMRVVAESMLVGHFGEEIMDDLFERFSSKIEEYLEVEEAKHTIITISMTKNV
ncbi:probable jasmonic acid carboxyl methyltransferase 2 [Juglans microcarpa x Juglans regia]|uniref:probable jasmonic acid carboxyl methyltransferase 2 n=1 Tax=Juglans microcarpa x Juglans regia TaxID=2249226 RepID=UPI001B7F693D|nr:probable jasmonic acid carboxyl methyltransferase 2 [Juglans microcarpa x Juglans regia]